jgi:TolA-binding protein
MKGWFALCCMLSSCAPALPAAYVRARGDAEAEYGHGAFAAAAESWLSAASAARDSNDRSEARYRAATSFERAGRLVDARALYDVLAQGQSERAARATFALAVLRLRAGDRAGGYAALDLAIHRYPASGVAGPALNRYFAALAEGGGDRAVLAYIDRSEPLLDRSELAEQLLYERARRLYALDAWSEARTAYLTVANRFPYPHGAYWDDALFYGAECELRLAHPERAIELLTRMLDARETAHLSGSYERPRFASAAYRIAEVYRDQLSDEARARTAFHRVFTDFPNSTLRDDALWQESLLAWRSSESSACAPLSLLLRDLPDSRYAACVTEICPKLPGKSGACHAYIQRALRDERAQQQSEP